MRKVICITIAMPVVSATAGITPASQSQGARQVRTGPVAAEATQCGCGADFLRPDRKTDQACLGCQTEARLPAAVPEPASGTAMETASDHARGAGQ